MPSEVVLTSRVTSVERAASRSSQRSMAMRRPSLGVKATPRSIAAPLRAVDQAQFGHARVDQGGDDGARRAAGAQHHDRPGRRRQSGAPCFSASRKPKPSLLRPSSVPSGCLITVFTAPMRAAPGWMRSSSGMISILCGRVRLQPRALGVRLQERHELFQRRAIGLDRQAAVVAVDAVLLQPEAVQGGRARMLDRPADDGGEGPAVGFARSVS